MNKLIQELLRLYLAPGSITTEQLAARIVGTDDTPLCLMDDAGLSRAIALPFRRIPGADDERHWTLLCEVANALQSELGLPAPAVSVSHTDGYWLWLSLVAPIRAEQAQLFVATLARLRFPELGNAADAVRLPVELPPAANPTTARWAAFINPSMGAAFVDEPGLEMMPPALAQAAFLERLESISPAQLAHAMQVLTTQAEAAPAAPVAAPARVAPADTRADTLLLKDATLEDIIRHLHAKNIEPTFRHLLK